MDADIRIDDENPDFSIKRLGECKIKSHLNLNNIENDDLANFTPDDAKILYDISIKTWKKIKDSGEEPPAIELAGPRDHLFFSGEKSHAAIVTCGGLCPGLNDVVRSIVMELYYHYNVKKITGIRYGYWGMNPANAHHNIKLTPDMVKNIQREGGSFLGSSRGEQSVPEMVDFLVKENINMLFTIGGDGTQRGALAICSEIEKRGLEIAVIGIPKTIDNDIAYLEKTFGFETAAASAKEVLSSAHNEATGYLNGIGLVKLMGRHSGFIACRAALASGDANFVLIPELPFDLEGEKGLFKALEARLRMKKHALIVVAEGAGQEYLLKNDATDASGNKKLEDIGIYLKKAITKHFDSNTDLEVTLKYIDPSYIIRSQVAKAIDQVYCLELGQNAVHAAMSGRTGMIVGSWNSHFTHIPMSLAISHRKKVDLESTEWRAVLESTGQPAIMKN